MSRCRNPHIVYLCTLFLSAAAWPATGQTVNLSLDVTYANPANVNSGGTWQLTSKATHRGLAGAVARVVNIASSPTFQAPTGTATGIPTAGFQPSFDNGTNPFWTNRGSHFELLFGQVPIAAPGPQGLFYDVGVPGGATQPGQNGTPAVAGLTGTSNVPWNFTDLLGDLSDDGQLNNTGSFHNGVLLASGTFAANVTPAFYAVEASQANLFTDVGTSTQPPDVGEIVAATVVTQVRNNTSLAGSFWNVDTSQDWATSANWFAQAVPDTTSEIATFGSKITAPRTITNNAARTVRSMIFNNSQAYTISGSGSLRLEAATGNASAQVQQGAHIINSALNLGDPTDLSVNTSSRLTLNGALNLLGQTLNKTGSGELIIQGTPTSTTGTLNLLAGTLSGSGTVGGFVVNSAGVLSPGVSGLPVVGSIPEPSTGMLIAGAAAMLAWVRRSSTKKLLYRSDGGCED